MSSKHHRRKCRCCNIFFTPDAHNPKRQFYCSAPECRRASKAASQKRWLQKPANRNYFRDQANVQRVQQWRKAHPGYWQRAKARSKPSQVPAEQALNSGTTSCNVPARAPVPLQDFVLTEDPAFVGLISMVTGSTLPEDIAAVGRNLLLQGRSILGLGYPQKAPANYDSKTIDPTRASAAGAAQLQLD